MLNTNFDCFGRYGREFMQWLQYRGSSYHIVSCDASVTSSEWASCFYIAKNIKCQRSVSELNGTYWRPNTGYLCRFRINTAATAYSAECVFQITGLNCWHIQREIFFIVCSHPIILRWSMLSEKKSSTVCPHQMFPI